MFVTTKGIYYLSAWIKYFRTSAQAAVIMMKTLLYDLMHRLEVVFTNPDGTLTIGTGAKEYAQFIASIPRARLYLNCKSLTDTLQSPILFSCDPFPVQGTLHITGPDSCHCTLSYHGEAEMVVECWNRREIFTLISIITSRIRPNDTEWNRFLIRKTCANFGLYHSIEAHFESMRHQGMDVRVLPGSEPFFEGETDVAYTDGSAITLMICSSIDNDDVTLEFCPGRRSSLVHYSRRLNPDGSYTLDMSALNGHMKEICRGSALMEDNLVTTNEELEAHRRKWLETVDALRSDTSDLYRTTVLGMLMSETYLIRKEMNSVVIDTRGLSPICEWKDWVNSTEPDSDSWLRQIIDAIDDLSPCIQYRP